MKLGSSRLLVALLGLTSMTLSCVSGEAHTRCPGKHTTLRSIPVVYLADVKSVGPETLKDVRDHKTFLWEGAKPDDAPTAVDICTTCEFVYYPRPRGYWEKKGRSPEEFTHPVCGLFQGIIRDMGVKHPSLVQRIRNGRVIYEHLNFATGGGQADATPSVLLALRHLGVQLQADAAKGTHLAPYVFGNKTGAYRLWSFPFYCGQTYVCLEREISDAKPK